MLGKNLQERSSCTHGFAEQTREALLSFDIALSFNGNVIKGPRHSHDLQRNVFCKDLQWYVDDITIILIKELMLH